VFVTLPAAAVVRFVVVVVDVGGGVGVGDAADGNAWRMKMLK
jgi:hypothetical protein